MPQGPAPLYLRGFISALVVWMALAAARSAILIGLGSGTTPWWKIVSLNAVNAITWTLITLAVRNLSLRIRDRTLFFRIGCHIAAIVLVGIIDVFVRRTAHELMIGPAPLTFLQTVIYYVDLTVLSYILAIWLASVIDARDRLFWQTRHEIALRAQLARARLSYLHAQLQPHFLFNALGTVSEQIFENPASAVRTFRQLLAVLRAAASRDAAEIPLEEEVESLMPYLEVQRTRFSDWLEIELDIQPDAAGVSVPPLILQPLVENSIRHGLRGRSSKGRVTITGRVRGDRLVLSVHDNGAGLSAARESLRSGVGLSNTEERLRTLYGSDARLRLFNDDLGGAIAEVSIPARRGISDSTEPDPAAPETVVTREDGFVQRHPFLALAGGCLLASALWTQQSYVYLTLSGRLGDRSLADIIVDDFVLVSLWALMVPIVILISRRVPVAGPRWALHALVHAVAAIVLGLAHASAAAAYRGGDYTALSQFRGSFGITLLVYLGVVAYSHRRILDEWLAARHLAALRISAGITETRIAAASMAVAPESLDFTLNELERYAVDNPLKAEQAIARLGSELRATLEAGYEGQPAPLDSGLAGTSAGENRVKRFAMGA
ncbi:MAG: sensor histidine kinase [Gemmatimonadaceae bacterium]